LRKNIFGTLLILATMLSTAHRSAAAFQPMLLSPGTFSLQAGANVIQIAAQCLGRSLEVPEAGHTFDQFSEGIKVARVLGDSRETLTLKEAIKRGWVSPQGNESIDNVGFTVSQEETKKGAKSETKVSDTSPQFVATGTPQVSDLKKPLATGGNVIANADKIVASFIDDNLPAWKSFLGPDFAPLFATSTENLPWHLHLAAENAGGIIDVFILVVIFLGVLLMSTLKVPYFYVGILLILVGVFFARKTGAMVRQRKEADATLETPSKFKVKFAGSSSAFCIFFGGLLSILSTPGMAVHVGRGFNISELKYDYTKEQKGLVADYLLADYKQRASDRGNVMLWVGSDPRWGDVLRAMDEIDSHSAHDDSTHAGD
jgi:hypothetical protein